MSATTLVAPGLEAEIEQLKNEIRELYPRSQAMRLEIGAKLLELQDKLGAPHGQRGTFIETVVTELHIPKSTCYELMEFARVKGEPEKFVRRLRQTLKWKQEPEDGTRERQATSRPHEKPYLRRRTQIHISVSPETREKLKKAVAKVNAAGPQAVKQLSERITREVFRAAAKIRSVRTQRSFSCSMRSLPTTTCSLRKRSVIYKEDGSVLVRLVKGCC